MKRSLPAFIKYQLILTLAILLGGIINVNGATYYSRADGDWNINTTWSSTSGGVSVGVGIYPVAGDNVIIESNNDVTVTSNAACNNLTVNGNSNIQTTLLQINSGIILAINGTFNIAGGTGNRVAGLTVNGTIEFASTVSLGTLNTIYIVGPSSTFSYIGNTNQAIQVVPGNFFYNLTLSGSGLKTFNAAAIVSGNFSMSGSATASPKFALTVSGSTTLSGTSTLTLGAANILSNTGPIVLGGGTFNTGATTGKSEKVGTLSLTENSTIALGTGSHTLDFSASNATAWTSGKTITITGWTGTAGITGTAGKIFFSSATGLTSTQLAQINFAGFTGTPILLGTGELVPASSCVSIGDPASFGSNTWNVYAYNGGSIDFTGTTYRGFYVEPNLSFDTRDRWTNTSSPSSASGYQGCSVNVDNMTFVHKRIGFPCGTYQISVGHDDDARLYVNGTNVWAKAKWNNAPELAWTGYLDENATVELRVQDGNGASYGQLAFVFTSSISVIPVVNSPICAGATAVGGTSTEANGTTITVYKGGVSQGTATVTSNTWTKTGMTALSGGDIITATALASAKCVSNLSAAITVNSLPQGSLTGNTVCSGGTGQFTFTSTLGTGPYTLIISGASYPGIVSGTAFNASPNPGSTTAYSLTSITDANGCVRTSGITVTAATITVNPNPTVDAGSAMAAICQGGTSAALGGAFGGGATSAVWSATSGTFANNDGSTPNTATFTAVANSTSPITLTLTTSGGSCGTTSATKDIVVNANITPTFTQLGPYCVGATPAVLPTTSTNGITGTWNSVISTATAGTTVYTFTPTAGLCATTATMSVVVNANITPTFTQLGPYCVGATPAALPTTSTNGINGTWSPSSISTALAGTTVYTFTPTAGLCATNISITITVNAIPTVTVNSPTKCADAAAATITATPVSGVAADYNYAWTVPSGATAPGNLQSFGAIVAGTYSVIITNKNTSCASASASGSLTVNPNPTSFPVTGGGSYCVGGTGVSVGLSNSESGVNYQLYNGVLTVGSPVAGSGSAISFGSQATAGTYTMVGTRTSGGCKSNMTGSAVVLITPSPSIGLTKTDETCPVENNGTITPTLSGGLTNIRYIKLTQKYVNADAWQQVEEIQAFEAFTNLNVALTTNGASASSSSVYKNDISGYGPQNVNDNITTGYNFWHSNSTNIDEWVKVDLGAGKNVDYLRIFNREDCCWIRGQNMLLELFDASNNLVYSKIVDLWGGINGANNINVNVLDLAWLDIGTTLNRTGLNSGSYTLNYADASGCSTSAIATIGTTNTESTDPASITGTSTICNGGNTTLTVSGGYLGTGASWHWYSGSCGGTAVGTGTSVNISPASTTTYYVRAEGTCNTTACVSQTVTMKTLPTAVISGTAAICPGISTNLSVALTGSQPWSITYTDGTTPVTLTGITTSPKVISVSPASTKTYTLTAVSDANCTGTSFTGSAIVTVDANNTVGAASSSPTLCINTLMTNISHTTTGATGIGTATGLPGGVSAAFASNTITISGTPSASGTFNYSIPLTGGCGTVSATGTITVTANVIPTFTQLGPYCVGATPSVLIATSNNSINGTWSPATISTASAGTGVYNFTPTAGQCATNTTMSVLVNTLPTASIGNNNGLALSCSRPNTTFTASGGGTYLWSTGATTAAVTVSAAGTFTVTVTGANGCTATTSASTTLDNTLPIASIGNNNGLALSCSVPNTTLTASGGTSYLWSTGATTAAITVSTAGTFTVTVTGANGCTATASVTTTLNNTPPTASITPTGSTTFCAGGSVLLTASTGSSWLWSTGDTTQAITATASGSYTVTVTNASGCSATSAATVVTVNALPTPTFINTATSACANDNVAYTTQSGYSNYLWTVQGTSGSDYTITAGTTGTASTSVTLKWLTAGPKTVSVNYTDGNGCTGTAASSIVTVNPLPTTGEIIPD